MTDATTEIAWLSFMPAYGGHRNGQSRQLGAHAFRTAAPRSLCGYVERERAGSPANDTARRCVWCQRVIGGSSSYRGHEGRGWALGTELTR